MRVYIISHSVGFGRLRGVRWITGDPNGHIIDAVCSFYAL